MWSDQARAAAAASRKKGGKSVMREYANSMIKHSRNDKWMPKKQWKTKTISRKDMADRLRAARVKEKARMARPHRSVDRPLEEHFGAVKVANNRAKWAASGLSRGYSKNTIVVPAKKGAPAPKKSRKK